MKVSLRIALVIVLGVTIAVGGLVVWFYTGIGLPKLSSLNEYKAAQNSKVFAADGTLLCELQGRREPRDHRAREDARRLPQGGRRHRGQDFYSHSGVNWKAVVRALWANVVKGSRRPGRQHHHPAVREERLRRSQADPLAKDPGSAPRLRARAEVLQGQDPRAVP